MPPDVTVECDSVPSAPKREKAKDNCDSSPPVEFSETRTDGNCPNTYTLTRTWTSTDSCGNTVSASQTIHVQDTTPPVLSGVPANVNLQCAYQVPSPAIVTAMDNCDPNVAVTLSAVQTPGTCADRFTLQRTWTATDSCGNTVSESQLIDVFDNTPPVITNNLQNVCLWPPNHNFWCASPSSIWSVSDNCNENLTSSLKYCNSSECDEAPCSTYPGENGDGNFVNDCQVISNRICFRSERAGTVDTSKHPVRYYWAYENYSDVCGNTALAEITVTIPHDNPNTCVITNYNPRGRG
jgi:hypothetical protein